MIQGVPTHLEFDPRLMGGDPSYTITKGPERSVYSFYTSQSYSNQQMQIQVFPNSMGTILDRQVLLELSVDFTLTAVNPANLVFPSGDPTTSGVIGLRWMPFASNCSTFSINVNGNTIPYTSYEFLNAFSQYNTPTDPLESLNWSFMPSCKNVGQTFDDTFGTNRSQFAPPYANTFQDSNAVTSNMTLISNNPGVAVVNCKWYEVIPYSPFLHGIVEREGLLGLNSALIFTWLYPSLDRLLGYDNVNGEPLASVSSAWAAAPILRVNWLSSLLSDSLNSSQALAYKYPWTNIQIYTNTPIQINPGTTVTATYSNIQLTGIPSCAFIFARQQIADRTVFDADSYAVIEGLNIQFNNQTGILSAASQGDLYKLARRNGLCQRFSDWAGLQDRGVGTVLKVQFDRDITLGDSSLAVAVSGTYQWSGTVVLTNINPNPINYVLYLIVCYEGILTIVDGSAVTQINLVTKEDVVHMSATSERNASDMHIIQSQESMIEGGSIISSAKNYINRGRQFYGAHKKTIDTVLNVGKEVGLSALQLLPVLLGAGLNYDEAVHHLQGAGFSGGGFSGGKLITDTSKLVRGVANANTNTRYRR